MSLPQKKNYREFLTLLSSTLEKYGIKINPENAEESIQALRKIRQQPQQEFPQMKNDRILQAFQKDPTLDYSPVWLMRQAGRYLPEFLEISKDFTFFERCENPFLATEITIQPIFRFQMDAAIIFSDILIIPKAIGMTITMEEKRGPVIHNPLKDPSDIQNLKKPDEQYLEHVYDSLYLTRLALDGKQTLIGFCGGPWTVFSYMVEGGSTKLFAKAKKWLYLWTKETLEVLELIADASANYLINQIKYGAQVVQIFDSWAGEIPAQDYTQFIVPTLVKMAKKIKDSCPNTPIIMFPKGQANVFVLQEFLKAENNFMDGFNLDHTISDETIQLLVENGKTIQGNMEPGVLYGPDELIISRIGEMIKKMKVAKKYIINLAHGLTPDHKPEKVGLFVKESQKQSN